MVSDESRRIWCERKVAELKAKGMTDIVELEDRIWFTDQKGRRMVWLHGDTIPMSKDIWEEIQTKRREGR